MYLKEETLFRSTQWPIIDADCKKDQVIVLLKGKGENSVQLNGKTIFTGPTGHWKIRFTKDHFCLLNHTTLSFYTLTGECIFECEVGNDIFELFPYRHGVLCIYGDEGVFGKKLGKNRLNYAAPFQDPESYYDIALQNQLVYDTLFARYKPYACLSFGMDTNELFFLDAELNRERTMDVPFLTGNIIAFALTYEFGVFLEENKLLIWEFNTTGKLSEYPGAFTYKTRAIFSRHEYLFMTVSEQEVRGVKPVLDRYS
ncbi:hypothetical protein ACRC6Q_09330 [Planococcus sp. SE5232]|uniref:hypothetical protein n=1 Tax=unclassified Planococcus (in: firmicutes) TaxID=2662419 RepID=UPI003D6A95AE